MRLTNTVTTFAGTVPGTDGFGAMAGFKQPNGSVVVGDNLFVADTDYNTIRRIVIATGEVTTLAGRARIHGSTDGFGTNALFNAPTGLATDGTNLFVTDAANNTIRKIVIATGSVTTLAGTAGTVGTTDGVGNQARFSHPVGITFDGTNLFVADSSNSSIRKIVTTTGEVTTFAGMPGTQGSADGNGLSASFYRPYDITTDGINLFVTDTFNHTIRRIILASGEVSTVAGMAGIPGFTDGGRVDARFNTPSGITVDGDNLFVADTGNHTIRKIVTSTGVVTTIAGSAGNMGCSDGMGEGAAFYFPTSITNSGHDLVVADSRNNIIRMINTDTRIVTTLAGTSCSQNSTEGTNIEARFNGPRSVTTDGANLFVADYWSHTIRKIVIATGVVTTLAGKGGASGTTDGTNETARFSFPMGITTDGTNLFVADTNNSTIRKIVIATGEVTTLAGKPRTHGSSDGTAAAALFAYPEGITTDGTNLFVADSSNNTIRKIVIATGAVTTLAGKAGNNGVNDGANEYARFTFPMGVVTDGKNVFVADSASQAIRKVVIASGEVTTVAGKGFTPGVSDGKGAVARFYYPSGITTDGTYLFVADTENHTIRKVVIATGEVFTIAGKANVPGYRDGVGASAELWRPNGITTDGTNLFVTDTDNNTIRKIE